MRRWILLVVVWAGCYKAPTSDEKCTIQCETTDGCPGDLTCQGGYCVSGDQVCRPVFRQVAAGTGFGCGLDESGARWCWGSNGHHQISPTDDLQFPYAKRLDLDRQWQVIDAGGEHACAISDGRLFCWGNNDRGQVSDAVSGAVKEPREIIVGAPWTAVVAGYNDTCGIAGGALYCWGAGDKGQLGTGSNIDNGAPSRVGMLDDWIEVSTGAGREGGSGDADTSVATPGTPWAHTCAISESQGLLCWGAGYYGELGDGTYVDNLMPVSVKLPATVRATHVAVGLYSTCAITDTSELYCWGYASDNALGDPAVVTPQLSGAYTNVPIRGSDLTGWTSLVSAEELVCGLRGDEVYCWGRSYGGGGLANGVWGTSGFQKIATGATAVSVGWNANVDEIGYDHGDLDLGCMLVSGVVQCWGDNRFGQLGQGGQVMETRPTKVVGNHVFSTLSAGAAHVCGIEAGHALCWGSTLHGEANGTARGTTAQPCTAADDCAIGTPRELAFVPTVDEIELGYGGGCARTGSAITCWGQNDKLQLGDAAATSPATIAGTWSELHETGSHGTCAVQNGETWCWGSVLGAGAAPARVPALEPMKTWLMCGPYDGSVYRDFGCGLDAANQLRCIADNGRGQFGNGTYTNGALCGNTKCDDGETASLCPQDCSAGPLSTLGRTYRSVVVSQPSLSYSTGYNISAYACAITNDAGVECWGRNYRGQMGTDPGGYPHTVDLPNRIAGLSNCTAVTASDFHACAICDDAVYCWGDHRFGAVGAGSITAVPITVARKVDLDLVDEHWAQLVSGVGFTCGRTDKGAAYCWGFAPYGALGTGATSSPLPLAVTLDY